LREVRMRGEERWAVECGEWRGEEDELQASIREG
jgi:hypothetical protein